METEEHQPVFEQQLKGESDHRGLERMLRRMLRLKTACMQLRWRVGESFLGGRGDRGQGKGRNESQLFRGNIHIGCLCARSWYRYFFFFFLILTTIVRKVVPF